MTEIVRVTAVTGHDVSDVRLDIHFDGENTHTCSQVRNSRHRKGSIYSQEVCMLLASYVLCAYVERSVKINISSVSHVELDAVTVSNSKAYEVTSMRTYNSTGYRN